MLHDRVVRSGECHLSTREELFNDPDRLTKPRHTDVPGIKADSDLVVLGLHVPRTEAEFETAVAKQIDRRRITRDKDWMTKVVVQHKCSDAQFVRRFGSAEERDERREDVGQVVWNEKRRVAERLGAASLLAPLPTTLGSADAHPEPEKLRHSADSSMCPCPSPNARRFQPLSVELPASEVGSRHVNTVSAAGVQGRHFQGKLAKFEAACIAACPIWAATVQAPA
jgi:hypothetical protein